MKLGNRIDTRLGDFHIDIDNLLNHFLGGLEKDSTCSPSMGVNPRANILESDTEFTVAVELPGVDPGAVNIEMMDGKLEISGEIASAPEAEGVKLLKAERRTGEFKRVFDFKSNVDTDQISAEFKNGLLTIKLPKPEKVLPRKIEIKTVD